MSVMPPELRTVATLGARDQVLAGIVLVALAALLALGARVTWKALRKHAADTLLTFLAASLTSGVVATGMWHFAGEVLHFSGLERWLLFGILEITVLTCAVRARRNIAETGGAGPEGIAIWVVSVMSGAFSATATTSAPEALFRLALPLLATWLWERSLLPARRESGKEGRWHAIAQRFLARLGMGSLEQVADAEAVARWRIAQLARAVVRAKRASRPMRKWRRYRVDVLTVAANEHAELATRKDRRDLLLSYIGTLLGTGTLIDLEPPAPWDPAAVKHAWEQSQDMSGDVSEEVPEASSGDAPEHDAGNPPDMPEGVPEASPPDRRRVALKLPASKSRSMTAAQLARHVGAMLDAYGHVSQPRIKTDLHVGTEKAAEALRIALAERGDDDETVPPLHVVGSQG